MLDDDIYSQLAAWQTAKRVCVRRASLKVENGGKSLTVHCVVLCDASSQTCCF